jgi:hypothetical protein
MTYSRWPGGSSSVFVQSAMELISVEMTPDPLSGDTPGKLIIKGNIGKVFNVRYGYVNRLFHQEGASHYNVARSRLHLRHKLEERGNKAEEFSETCDFDVADEHSGDIWLLLVAKQQYYYHSLAVVPTGQPNDYRRVGISHVEAVRTRKFFDSEEQTISHV